MGDPRLADFLDWVVEMGVSSRAADYRRVALELFALAGDKRITESHILKLLDSYAESPNGREATVLIEEVGEALLRYEAMRKAHGGPLTARRTPTEPVVARPDERVAGDLRLPDSSRDTGPERRVVSFTGTGPHPIPREAPAQASAPVAVTPTPRPAESSRGPEPRKASEPRRRTGSQFRCPRCRVMVMATDGGVCPRCGTAPARISSGQLPVEPRSSGPSLSSWALPAVLGVAAFFLAFQFGPGLLDRLRDPSQPAAGTASWPHLGVQLTLPDGWRHASAGDRAPTTSAEGFEAILPELTGLRSSRFFVGSSRDPDAELIVAVAPRASRVTDDVLRAWADHVGRGKIQRTLRDLSGLPGLVLEHCATGAGVPRGALRCNAVSGNAPAVTYVFGARGVLGIAVYIDRGGVSDVTAAADAVVSGLNLG